MTHIVATPSCHVIGIPKIGSSATYMPASRHHTPRLPSISSAASRGSRRHAPAFVTLVASPTRRSCHRSPSGRPTRDAIPTTRRGACAAANIATVATPNTASATYTSSRIHPATSTVSVATTSRNSMMMPSSTRSMNVTAIDCASGIPARSASIPERTSSPRRAGRTLFAA